MRLQGILWDNDGVLVDTERLFYQANRELFLPFGVDLSERDFYHCYLADHCGAWHLLAHLALSEERIAELRAGRNQRYAQLLLEAPIAAIAGVPELLSALSPQLAMGVVTSSLSSHFELIHSRQDLLRHFRFVLTAEQYTHCKPSPEPDLLGLKKLGLAPAQCVVVEDAPRGLQAATAAGLRCIVLRTALTEHAAFPGPWRIVDDVAELHAELAALAMPEH